MLEHFFKSLVATVSDPYQCNRITDALAAAGIKFYCKSKDVNRHNTFDQARIGTLGIKPRYVTEVFVDLSLIHISEPTRRTPISYAVFCLKKKKSLNVAKAVIRLSSSVRAIHNLK